MTLKQFGLFAFAWLAICSVIIEPAYITPYFNGLTGIELAFNGSLPNLGEPVNTSNDHFRVLCLLYFGLPCAIYLLSQMLSSDN